MAELNAQVKGLWQRVTWSESSGAVGDLGTFLPLLVRACTATQALCTH